MTVPKFLSMSKIFLLRGQTGESEYKVVGEPSNENYVMKHCLEHNYFRSLRLTRSFLFRSLIMPRSVYSDVTTLSGLTTASTLSVHDILPTPGDERSDPLSHGAAVSKHREFSSATSALGSAEIFDSYQEAFPYIHQTAPNIHIIHASSDDSLVPSVPPTPPPKSPSLAIHRRRSTKELISIYESTSSTPSSNHNTTTSSENRGQYESRNSTRSKNQNPKILKTRPSDEGRWNPAAPMRYSFQNLLGVFGKKQRQSTKEFTVFRPPAKIPELSSISTVNVSFLDCRMHTESNLIVASTYSFDRGSIIISVSHFIQCGLLERVHRCFASSVSSTFLHSTVTWDSSHLLHQYVPMCRGAQYWRE
jgi:hypothetical protein